MSRPARVALREADRRSQEWLLDHETEWDRARTEVTAERLAAEPPGADPACPR